jgi:hypothetical protein
MKDFLQGRPSVTPTHTTPSNLNLHSNLPPISQNAITVEEPAMLLDEIPQAPLEEAPPASNPTPLLEEPRVEMVPDSEGRIGHIVVTCRCGEVITLQCNY